MASPKLATADLLPRWTKRAARDLGGRDPLGLSRVAQMLADSLLPGIITQTDRARYYALYSWILWHLEQEGEAASWDAFVSGFQRREASIALSTLIGDPNWRALFSEQLEDITRAGSPAEFESRVNALIARGGLSHVAFFHQSAQRAPARYSINATFCAFDTQHGSRWLFEDVHDGGPAHGAGIRPGDLLLNVNGRSIAPPELPTFALGTDARVTIESPDGGARDVTVILPKADPVKRNAKPPMAEPTSVVARAIKPGIGYLRVAFFPGVNGQRFARELDRALVTLQECSHLIVDLRGNLGGFVGSLRLMSHLTPGRVPVGYSLTRKGEDRKWRPEQLACIDRLPATRLDTLKMAVRFLVLHRDRSIRLVTEGLGPKPFHGRVVMLVNEHTLSAGEMVAA